MSSSFFQRYVSWVRENGENALSLERFTQLAARIVMDPRDLASTELAWTLMKLHSLSNRVILSTAGRRVGFKERVDILLKTVSEVECLLELSLRRYYGHGAAWNVLLALQSFKCLLNLCVHQQLFILPSIWAAIRRRLRQMLQHFMRLPEYGRRVSSAVREGITASFIGPAPSVSVRSGTIGPANTPLVIPRVAVRRTRHRSAAAANSVERECVAEKVESFPCTGIDLLGLLVDLILVLRPLLLVFFARRVFPTGASGIATLPVPSKANSDKPKDDASSSAADTEERDGLFILRAAMNDGVSKSLLSSWGVGLSFFGLDVVLALLSRYIRRHRVPIVYIDTGETPRSAASDKRAKDGEVSTRGDDSSSVSLNNNNGNGGSREGSNGNNGAAASVLPPLPPPPMGDVAELTPAVSRDTLRLREVFQNMAFSFLRDPFCPALLQQFLYKHFILGRINRIPFLGPLLAMQVAYFLCKQHYCFMYLL